MKKIKFSFKKLQIETNQSINNNIKITDFEILKDLGSGCEYLKIIILLNFFKFFVYLKHLE